MQKVIEALKRADVESLVRTRLYERYPNTFELMMPFMSERVIYRNSGGKWIIDMREGSYGSFDEAVYYLAADVKQLLLNICSDRSPECTAKTMSDGWEKRRDGL